MKVPQNILLIDDYLVVRKGFEIILKEKLSNVTIYNCSSYSDGIKILHKLEVSIVLVDIRMNGIENIKFISEIKKIRPNSKILVFTYNDENQDGLRYIKHGADGFLNKSCTEDIIAEALRSTIFYGYYYSKELESKLDKKLIGGVTNPIESLSNREYEISKMLISGLGNLEIANKLNIKMSTVSTYKSRIFQKLSINNIVSLSDFFKNE